MRAGADACADRAWFPALADAQLRLYLTGQSVSILGAWVLDITLNLLVWQQTGSPATLGLLNFLLYGPMVVVTPLLASRLHAGNARRIALVVLVGALVVALGLAAATVTHSLGVPLLLAAATARGVLAGMEIPSRQMLLLNLGEADSQRSSAIAMNTLVFVVARMVGPAIAAMMFEPIGPLGAFLLAALALAFMTGCVMRMRPRAPIPGGLAAGRGGFYGALAFARRDGFASLMLPVLVCLALCASSHQTLVPVLAERVFGDAARWSGWFFATAGGGALVAALLLSSRHAEALSRRWLVASPWFAAVALVLIGAIRHPLGVLPAFALLGFCTSFCATATNAGLHRRCPPEARGGLIGLFLTAFTGMGPVAQLLAGGLAQFLPVAQTLYVLASLLVASLLLVYGRRWWQLRRLELDADAL